MRFALLAVGPRGDVQPMVALAIGLRAAGHDVSIVTHGCYAGIGEDFNLPVVRLSTDMEGLLESPAASFLRDARKSNAALLIGFLRLIAPYYGAMGQECLDASFDADVVIGNPVSAMMALTIAESLDVRSALAFWSPTYPSRRCAIGGLWEAPSWVGPTASLYYWYAFLGIAAVQWSIFGRRVNRWRTSIGRRPLGLYGPLDQFLASTHLQAYSETLAPRPPDWPDHVHVTGHWFLPHPADWTPSGTLTRFLSSGDPPVAVALGSMHRGTYKVEMIVKALRRRGLRGVLTGAVGDPGSMGRDDMFYTRSIPHDWLFERASAVVHHGGGGTMARVVRTGLPSVTLPAVNDEPFWANTLHARGVATEPLGWRELTVDRLADAIQTATTDTAMRERARELGSRMAGENGVERAVEILETLAKS